MHRSSNANTINVKKKFINSIDFKRKLRLAISPKEAFAATKQTLKCTFEIHNHDSRGSYGIVQQSFNLQEKNTIPLILAIDHSN